MFKIKKLENFAVIEKLEDELELKDLTIFMGDNSSGKSYLAMLIHSFFLKSFNSNNIDFFEIFSKKFNNIESLSSLIKNITSVIESKKNGDITLPSINILELDKVLDFIINEYYIKRELPKLIFGIEMIGNIDVKVSKLYSTPEIRLLLREESSTIDVNVNMGEYTITRRVGFIGTIKVKEVFNDIIKVIISTKIKINENYVYSQSIYLPASRTGYLQTYNILANKAIMENYSSEENREKNSLSILIRRFITQLNQSRGFTNNEFSKYIEEFILNGKVNIYKDSNAIDFELKSGEKIDINYLSSTVSELIPLVVFLKRGLIQKGGLVVIEEPEAHLSFKNQKMMAKLITLLINHDIKVLITTHSDFLVYELNNLIMKDTIRENREQLGDKIDKDLLEDNITLDYNRVGLYNFLLNDNNRSTVSRVKIDKYGIDNKYIFDSTYSIVEEKDRLLDLMDLIDG